jgi:lipopolysaccharide/colanic/teichoic acid biosynthesis glycosyltransferase
MYSIIKRLLDFFSVLLLLLILLPVFLIVALVLFVTGHRPVLFIQPRLGYKQRVFHLFKFRTMTDKKDEKGNLLPDAVRLTSLGLRLRKMSLDELPQLINVLRGDMSLVGPRPLLVEYGPRYNDEQRKRHDVRPGITGWAQVNGRNAVNWDQRFDMDVWYVKHRTFWLDLKILLLTVKKIFKQEGIAAQGHVTMEPFKGNLN